MTSRCQLLNACPCQSVALCDGVRVCERCARSLVREGFNVSYDNPTAHPHYVAPTLPIVPKRRSRIVRALLDVFGP